MGLHASQPQAVDALVGSLPVGQRHVDHRAVQAPLPAVQGVHASQEHPLVVRMGGHQQKVRLFEGRLRVRHVLGHGPGAEDADLRDPEVLPLGQDMDLAAALGKGHGQGRGVRLHDPLV